MTGSDTYFPTGLTRKPVQVQHETRNETFLLTYNIYQSKAYLVLLNKE